MYDGWSDSGGLVGMERSTMDGGSWARSGHDMSVYIRYIRVYLHALALFENPSARETFMTTKKGRSEAPLVAAGVNTRPISVADVSK